METSVTKPDKENEISKRDLIAGWSRRTADFGNEFYDYNPAATANYKLPCSRWGDPDQRPHNWEVQLEVRPCEL